MHTHLCKVGHFTLDNASNNATMMESLEARFRSRDIVFDAKDNRIRCFAHVINLCSGRVVDAASDGIQGTDGYSSSSSSDIPIPSNPIARARMAVQAIRGSGSHRDAFQQIIVKGNANGLFKEGEPPVPVQVPVRQLLQDVRTRWDSVYLMLRRLRDLRPVRPYSFQT